MIKILLFISAFGIVMGIVRWVKAFHASCMLEEFRCLYSQWLETSRSDQEGWGFGPGDQELRSLIRGLVPGVSRVLYAKEMGVVIKGGLVIQLLENCINQEMLNTGDLLQNIVDEIGGAIYIYTVERRIAFLSIFYPVYWIKCVIRFPFIILDLAGFTTFSTRFENSVLGKLLKVFILVVGFCGAVATLLIYADNPAIPEFLKRMFDYLKRMFD